MEKIKIECDCCNRYIYIERKNGEYRCSYCDNIIKFELLEVKKVKEKLNTGRIVECIDCGNKEYFKTSQFGRRCSRCKGRVV